MGHVVVLEVKQASMDGDWSAVFTRIGYAAGQMAAGDARHSLRVVPSRALTRKPVFVHTQVLLVALAWLLGTLEQLTGTNSQHVALLSVVIFEAFARSPKSGGHVNGTVTLGFVRFGLMLVHVGTATQQFEAVTLATLEEFATRAKPLGQTNGVTATTEPLAAMLVLVLAHVARASQQLPSVMLTMVLALALGVQPTGHTYGVLPFAVRFVSAHVATASQQVVALGFRMLVEFCFSTEPAGQANGVGVPLLVALTLPHVAAMSQQVVLLRVTLVMLLAFGFRV